MRVLKYTLLILVSIILISTLVAGLGTGTDTGSHWLIKQARNFLPGELDIETVQGNLLNRLELHNVHYRQDELDVKIQHLVLAWRPTALFGRKLIVEQLKVANATIQLPTPSDSSETTSEPFQLPEIKLPLAIQLQEILLENITIQPPAGLEPLVIEQAKLQANADDTLTINTLTIRLQQFTAQTDLSGSLGLLRPHAIDLKLNGRATLPEMPELAVNLNAKGDINDFKLTVEASEPLNLQVDGNLKNLLSNPSWQLALTWADLQYPLVGDSPDIRLQNGHVHTQGDLNDYQLDLGVAVSGAQIPPSQWQIKANGNLEQLSLSQLRGDLLDGYLQANGDLQWQPVIQGQLNFDLANLHLAPVMPDLPANIAANAQLVTIIDNNQLTLQNLQANLSGTPITLTGSGHADLNDLQQPKFDLQLDWQHLQYPFSGTAVAALPSGQLTAKGQPDDWQVALKTQVAGSQIPHGDWQLRAHGDMTQAEITELTGNTLQGELNATAQVQWQPVLNAHVDLSAQDLVLTELWADWAKELGLNAQVNAQFTDQILTLQQADIEIPRTNSRIKAQGTVALTDPAAPQLDLKLDLQQLRWPLTGKDILAAVPSGKAHLTGTPSAYQLTLDAALEGEQVPDSKWHLAVTGNEKKAKIDSLQGDLLTGRLDGSGQVQWVPKLQAQVQLNADRLVLTELVPDWSPSVALNSRVKVQFADNQLQLEQVNVNLPSTGAQFNVTGSADLNKPDNPEFNLRSEWQKLQFPPKGEAQVASESGNLQVKGRLKDYRVSMNAKAGGSAIPATQISLSGRGSDQNINLPDIKINTLDGVIKINAEAKWLPQVSWRVDVNGSDINPAKQWPELTGKLDLKLRSAGKITDRLQANVDVTEIKGQLMGYPFELVANAQANGARYQLSQFKLLSGENSLTAKADYGQQLSAEWKLNAPQLAAFLPDGQGSLTGQGRISGTVTAPQISAQLRGDQLGTSGLTLKTFAADVNADLRNQNSPLTLSVTLDEVRQNGQSLLDSLRIEGDGTLALHQITLTANAPTQELQLQLAGGLAADKPRWQGRLQQLQVDFVKALKQLGRWQLAQPAPITLAAGDIQLQNACLQQDNGSGRICLAAQQQASGSQVQLNITALPLALGYPDITGDMTGQLQASYGNDGQIAADGQFKVSSGVFRTEVDGAPKELKHQGGTVQLRINEQGLVVNSQFDLLQGSRMESLISLPRFNRLPMAPDQQIQATLTGQVGDLSVLPTFVPMISEAKGALSWNLWAGGTLDKPLIGGEVLMRDAMLDIPELGLELRNINVEVVGDKENFGEMRLNISADSGEGQLQITGQGNALKQVAKLQIKGDKFRVINNIDAFVVISPDLAINMNGEKLSVTGSLTVPEANITPNLVVSDGSTSVGGAVRASQDVVVINDPNASEEQAMPSFIDKLALMMDVTLKLGNKVLVDAVGFKSQIAGQIRLTHRPQQVDLIPTANGELQIVDGTFRSYGQDLEIERGRIIFANSPVTEPELNIKAFRRIYGGQDVELAGVHITGTPDKINLTLFSNPQLPQDQVLSYILTGQGFDPDSEDRTVGLGTYVLPNLYISYGISLLDQTNVFSVRYELNKTWGVEVNIAEEDKGVDFSYTLER